MRARTVIYAHRFFYLPIKRHFNLLQVPNLTKNVRERHGTEDWACSRLITCARKFRFVSTAKPKRLPIYPQSLFSFSFILWRIFGIHCKLDYHRERVCTGYLPSTFYANLFHYRLFDFIHVIWDASQMTATPDYSPRTRNYPPNRSHT